MHLRTLAMAGLAALSLAACAPPDLASRQFANPSTDIAASGHAGDLMQGEVRLARYSVREVRVEVPRELTVSEANLYYPIADIVWRGEPRGDRHEQVRAILAEAADLATRNMRQGPEVIVDLRVVRFHSVTEKTRYTFGGVHSIRFDLTVRDVRTGAVLEGPRRIVADVKASGGQRAVEEEGRGLTQRVVIVYNLGHTILRELSEPGQVSPEVPLTRIDDDLRLKLAAVSSKGELSQGVSDLRFGLTASAMQAAGGIAVTPALTRAIADYAR
ncbi:MAG: DUF6778 family protein [Gemmobacter sp.]